MQYLKKLEPDAEINPPAHQHHQKDPIPEKP
jgi:hypothetical protein